MHSLSLSWSAGFQEPALHEDDARRLLGHPAAGLRRDDAPVDDGRIRGTIRRLLEHEPGNHLPRASVVFLARAQSDGTSDVFTANPSNLQIFLVVRTDAALIPINS